MSRGRTWTPYLSASEWDVITTDLGFDGASVSSAVTKSTSAAAWGQRSALHRHAQHAWSPANSAVRPHCASINIYSTTLGDVRNERVLVQSRWREGPERRRRRTRTLSSSSPRSRSRRPFGARIETLSSPGLGIHLHAVSHASSMLSDGSGVMHPPQRHSLTMLNRRRGMRSMSRCAGCASSAGCPPSQLSHGRPRKRGQARMCATVYPSASATRSGRRSRTTHRS